MKLSQRLQIVALSLGVFAVATGGYCQVYYFSTPISGYITMGAVDIGAYTNNYSMVDEPAEEEHQTITDKMGVPYRLCLRITGELWVIEVWDNRVLAATANCLRHNPENLHLSDILTHTGVPLPLSWWRKLLRRRPKLKNYRGRGLGPKLLRFIVETARQSGVQQITGDLLPQSIKEWPDLPDWYREQGFEVTMTSDSTGRILLRLNPVAR